MVSALESFQFKKVGEYFRGEDGNVDRRASEGVKITDRLPMVYAICVDGAVCYIGETIQGYTRPLNYHRNDVMIRVRDGIRAATENEGTAEVFARTSGLDIEHEGLQLNIRQAIEIALVRKLKPAWNKQDE